METATTRAIQVSVESFFLEDESDLKKDHYVFAYRVQLKNEGGETVRLMSRHWIITDSTGEVSEVKGPGVVGEQPVLSPGEDYEYVSGSHLKSPLGTMQGTYQLVTDKGEEFDAAIPVFTLSLPQILN